MGLVLLHSHTDLPPEATFLKFTSQVETLLTSDWNGKDRGIGEGRTIRIGRGRTQHSPA